MGKWEKGKKRKREKGKKKKRKREKEKKQKNKNERASSAYHERPILEMASEGPQRITEKYYAVYLPSYIIYPFDVCHQSIHLSYHL